MALYKSVRSYTLSLFVKTSTTKNTAICVPQLNPKKPFRNSRKAGLFVPSALTGSRQP
jgi:hypothetical protein